MATKPKLALIPSAYKAGKVYSVLPADGVGDFDFSRPTTATTVNEDGLIETVGSNIPRLNYPMIDGVVSGCPSLLLEPQRTNLVTYSEEFDNPAWLTSRATITENSAISPKGDLTADFVEQQSGQTNSGGCFIALSTSIGDVTLSVFAKASTKNWIILGDTNFGSVFGCWFDLQNGVVGTQVNTVGKIEDYGNGWYRCSITYNQTVGTAVNKFIYVADTDNSNAVTDSGGIYIWGAQLEQGSYATSYIPTNGSTVTREAETCNGAGDASTFNDSEGVLMADISALSDSISAYSSIGLGSGSSNNRIGLGFSQPNSIYVFKKTTSSWFSAKVSNIDEFNKVAISYNTNDNHFWLNGFKIASNTTIGDIVQPTELKFQASYGGETFYGNTKQIQYFDTALNDTDLEELTSWRSFNEMAQAQQYTII